MQLTSMDIVLMRHGQPRVPALGRIAASEMGRWIAIYNESGIMEPLSRGWSHRISSAQSVVVTSTAQRARESVAALGLEATIVDTLFMEAGLPYLDLSWPRLLPYVWTAIFRRLW